MIRRGLLSIAEIVAAQGREEESFREESAMKDQLKQLVAQMYAGGMLYSEAVREFKKSFIRRVLQQNKFNQCKAAKEIGMHRNTFSRTVAELGLRSEFPGPSGRRKPVERVMDRQYVTGKVQA